MASSEFIPFVPKNTNFKDATGQRFGRLTAIEPMRRASAPNRGAFWRCLCDCGNETVVDNACLRSGNTNSCGCYQKDRAREAQTKHLQCNTRTYHAWSGMRQRCVNAKTEHFQHYGGRGIAYDPRWDDFEAFLADMGECPPGLTLDRRDNDGSYRKDNCRWATKKDQANNKRNTFMVEYQGKRMSLHELSVLVGMNHQRLYHRLHAGWTAEQAVSQPMFASRFKRK